MQQSLTCTKLDGSGSGIQTGVAVAAAAGSTIILALSIVRASGLALDLAGSAVIMTVRANDRYGSTLILSRQAEITDEAGGLAQVTILADDTYALRGSYVYDITVIDADGNRDQVMPISPFFMSPGLYVPNQSVSVPESQQPLAQGLPGEDGEDGADGGTDIETACEDVVQPQFGQFIQHPTSATRTSVINIFFGANSDQTFNMPAGARVGQRKTFILGGTFGGYGAVITPSSLNVGVAVRLGSQYDSCELEWQGSVWTLVGLYSQSGTATVITE